MNRNMLSVVFAAAVMLTSCSGSANLQLDDQQNKNISEEKFMPDNLTANLDDISIDKIIQLDYKMEYKNECKYIWNNYVPDSGISDCLQGELLREIEKLRYEAQDNGNVNWDDDFRYFCDFISSNICASDIYDEQEKQTIKVIIKYIKEHGEYAAVCYDDSLSDDDIERITGKEWDVNNIAYVDDNIYDIVADKIGKMQKNNPKPIPYKHGKEILR